MHDSVGGKLYTVCLKYLIFNPDGISYIKKIFKNILKNQMDSAKVLSGIIKQLDSEAWWLRKSVLPASYEQLSRQFQIWLNIRSTCSTYYKLRPPHLHKTYWISLWSKA